MYILAWIAAALYAVWAFGGLYFDFQRLVRSRQLFVAELKPCSLINEHAHAADQNPGFLEHHPARLTPSD